MNFDMDHFVKNLENAYSVRFSRNRDDWRPIGLLLGLDQGWELRSGGVVCSPPGMESRMPLRLVVIGCRFGCEFLVRFCWRLCFGDPSTVT